MSVVKRNERVCRLGLILAYTVMTVWAQAGDRHGHHAAAETRCDDVCRDPSPHFSGHAAADLERTPSDCPACQLRSNLHVTTPTTPARGGGIVARLEIREPIEPTLRVVGIPSCRAPPTA